MCTSLADSSYSMETHYCSLYLLENGDSTVRSSQQMQVDSIELRENERSLKDLASVCVL